MSKLYLFVKKGILLASLFCFAQPILAQLPVIYSFSPDSGQFGTQVTIRGIHFTGATEVQFGGWPSFLSITVVSDSVIKATVGAGSSGAVTVKTPAGTASKNGFVYITPPIAVIFSPKSGTTGTLVGIQGWHFNGATSVKFGGVEADSFWVVADTYIYAIVGNGATGLVSVSTPFGSSSLPGFTYTDTPQVTATSRTSAAGNPLTGVTVYPNPANSYTLVKHPASNHAASLQLTDITGRVIKIINVNKNAVQTRVDVKGLAHGVYKLLWKGDGKFISQSLIIQ